jgi:hypothetical protein
MTPTAYVIVSLLVLMAAWAAWDVVRAARMVWHFRGPRVVTCPKTGLAVAVRIDLGHAFARGLIGSALGVRLGGGLPFAECRSCEEPCASEAAEPSTTARAIVARGVTGHLCVFCGRPIESTTFLDHHSAFLQPDGSTIEWPNVPPERLRATIADRPAVCWDCHIAETFRRTYPELVTDRPWRQKA